MSDQKKEKHLIEILSHDIRNPLLVILGQCEVAIENLKEKGQTVPKYLEKIKKAANKIEDILNLVRDLRSLELGKQSLQLTSIDLAEIQKSLLFTFEDKLIKKDLKLIFADFDKYKIIAESISLEHQVFNNLISNAIKFSLENSSIVLTAKKEDKHIIVTVKDSGIGMPSKLLEDIFKIDVKTTRKGTSGEVGTGFGMPLVKGYLEQYGASIKIESKEKTDDNCLDHGTTFILSFKSV